MACSREDVYKRQVYTTADVDAPVWSEPMLRELFAFIETKPEAEKYRGMNWDVELRAASRRQSMKCCTVLILRHSALPERKGRY